MRDTWGQGIDDRTLDRLVDGELSDTEYREVVAALDSQADDWRRCALAFLEAQAWHKEMACLAPRGDSRVPKLVSRRDPSGWHWAGLICLASAASFLLAFSLARWTGDNPGLATGSDAERTGLVGLGHSGQPVPSPTLAAATAAGAAPPEVELDGAWGSYRLIIDGDDGQPRQIEMPVFAGDDPRAHSLFNEHATGPWELIHGLQRLGFQVDRQRWWTPVDNDLGEPIVVPIEELRITPVSTRQYQ